LTAFGTVNVGENNICGAAVTNNPSQQQPKLKFNYYLPFLYMAQTFLPKCCNMHKMQF